MSNRLTKDELEAFLADYKLLCLKHGMYVNGYDSVWPELATENPAYWEDHLDTHLSVVRESGEAVIAWDARNETAARELENIARYQLLKEGAD